MIKRPLLASALLAAAITVAGVSLRSTSDTPAGAQVVSRTPSQGATGPAGAAGSIVQARTVTTATNGTVSWTYPSAYPGGVNPVVGCVAEAPTSTTYSIDCMLDGAPSTTQAKFRVVRSDITTVALLGLNILSIPANPGATTLHVTVQAP